MELTPAGLKRAAFSLQLLLCTGMQLCRAAGCSAELPVAEVPVPWLSLPKQQPKPFCVFVCWAPACAQLCLVWGQGCSQG